MQSTMSDHDNGPIETEEVFNPSIMKKKKKSSKNKLATLVSNDESTEPHGVTNSLSHGIEDEDLDFSKLKKKKKIKKSLPVTANDNLPTTSADYKASDMSIKKRNKNVTKNSNSDFDNVDVEAPIPFVNYHERIDEDSSSSDGDDFDVADSDHDVPADENTNFGFSNEDDLNDETWIGTDRDYTYEEILTRVFRILHAKNPALAGGRKRYTIVPPQVAREGSKKTVFANIDDICTRMRRNYDHLVTFLYAELGTSGSVDGAKRLIIKGRFQPKQIENVLRRYIIEYVTCKTCKSPETVLRKENRLYFMQCESCGSSRSVSAIQGGFKAQVGSRKAAKAKAS